MLIALPVQRNRSLWQMGTTPSLKANLKMCGRAPSAVRPATFAWVEGNKNAKLERTATQGLQSAWPVMLPSSAALGLHLVAALGSAPPATFVPRVPPATMRPSALRVPGVPLAQMIRSAILAPQEGTELLIISTPISTVLVLAAPATTAQNALARAQLWNVAASMSTAPKAPPSPRLCLLAKDLLGELRPL